MSWNFSAQGRPAAVARAARAAKAANPCEDSDEEALRQKTLDAAAQLLDAHVGGHGVLLQASGELERNDKNVVLCTPCIHIRPIQNFVE
jgi:hypothetical protein